MLDTPETDAPETLVDAITLLKSDHRKVEDLFVQYEAAKDDGDKKELASQICMELKIHTMIEEEIFYPALRGKIEDDMIDEAYVEHDGAKVLINDIGAGRPGDEFYDTKVTVLSEQIKHHVHEEEMPDIGMFAQARASGIDLLALGAELKARKQELMIEGTGNGLPPAKSAVVNLAAA
jgi:hypothetical protein